MSTLNIDTHIRSYFVSRITRNEVSQAEAYFWASVDYECIVYDTAIENGVAGKTTKYYLSCKPLVQSSIGNKLNGDRI